MALHINTDTKDLPYRMTTPLSWNIHFVIFLILFTDRILFCKGSLWRVVVTVEQIIVRHGINEPVVSYIRANPLDRQVFLHNRC